MSERAPFTATPIAVDEADLSVVAYNQDGLVPAIVQDRTTGDVLTMTVYNSGLSGGHEAVTYTVIAGDTLTTIAAGLVTAINTDSHLLTLAHSSETGHRIKANRLAQVFGKRVGDPVQRGRSRELAVKGPEDP